MSDIVSVALQYEIGRARTARLRNPFFEVLAALNEAGSIAQAARDLGWSYRHLWGYLREQEGLMGRPLVLWDRGRSARLSPLPKSCSGPKHGFKRGWHPKSIISQQKSAAN